MQSETRDTLEETCEMMRKIKAKQAGSLADVMTLHQQAFRLIYNIIMYVADCRATRGL